MKLREIRLALPADGHWLPGCMHHAPHARALVVLLHCGHSEVPAQLSALLESLHAHGFATLVLDLLEAGEETRDPDAAFNVPHLVNRVQAAVNWAAHQPDLKTLEYFAVASGTACAAVIRAAVRQPDAFGAIVCFGGRPDLAGASPLSTLATPTRLIVTPDDPDRAIALRTWPVLPQGHDLQDCTGPETLTHASALAVDWLTRAHEPAPANTTGAHD